MLQVVVVRSLLRPCCAWWRQVVTGRPIGAAFSRSFSDADCHAERLEMALQSIYPLPAAEQKQVSGIEENA